MRNTKRCRYIAVMPKTKNIGRPAGKGKYSGKLIHIRLTDDLAEAVEEIIDNRIEGATVSSLIREALAEYVRSRKVRA